jgi:hypothetical protein
LDFRPYFIFILLLVSSIGFSQSDLETVYIVANGKNIDDKVSNPIPDQTSTLRLPHNKRTAEPLVLKESKAGSRLSYGLVFGENYSMLTLESDILAKGKFEPCFSPTGGLFINVNSRKSEHFSIGLSALYMSSNYKRYDIYESSERTERYYTTIELQQIKVPFSVRYTLADSFSEKKFTTFFDAGLSTTVHLSSSSDLIYENMRFNVVATTESEATPISAAQAGIWCGVGVLRSINQKLAASLEIRCERTSGITPRNVADASPTSRVTNFQLLFTLRAKDIGR